MFYGTKIYVYFFPFFTTFLSLAKDVVNMLYGKHITPPGPEYNPHEPNITLMNHKITLMNYNISLINRAL
jgi:hypothetical protein